MLLCPALFGVPCVRSCSTYTEPRLRVQVSEELDGRELRRQARAKYDTMTLSQLQATCDQSWVDASGSREEMIERLIHYEASTNDWPVRLIVAPQVTLHYVYNCANGVSLLVAYRDRVVCSDLGCVFL